jgi:hypothetical protein
MPPFSFGRQPRSTPPDDHPSAALWLRILDQLPQTPSPNSATPGPVLATRQTTTSPKQQRPGLRSRGIQRSARVARSLDAAQRTRSACCCQGVGRTDVQASPACGPASGRDLHMLLPLSLSSITWPARILSPPRPSRPLAPPATAAHRRSGGGSSAYRS